MMGHGSPVTEAIIFSGVQHATHRALGCCDAGFWFLTIVLVEGGKTIDQRIGYRCADNGNYNSTNSTESCRGVGCSRQTSRGTIHCLDTCGEGGSRSPAIVEVYCIEAMASGGLSLANCANLQRMKTYASNVQRDRGQNVSSRKESSRARLPM